MQSARRVVTSMPLVELFDESGSLPHQRGQFLGLKELRNLLSEDRVQFIVADVGCPLNWIPANECFEFFKCEVRPQLADADQPADLEDFPAAYCYFASRWLPQDGLPIVLLEKHH
jgi:hypothetical protein